MTVGKLVGWNYQKKITLNNTGAALTDYQVKFTVNRSAGTDTGFTVYVGTKCESDYDDIRFTKADGTTLLDYWIESSSATVATVWVEVPSLPTGDTTAYLYYGNAAAAAVSDGDATFPFFDDFLGSSLDGDKWPTQSGSISVSGSAVTLQNTLQDTAQGIKGDDVFGYGYTLVFYASMAVTGASAWPECSFTGITTGVAAIVRYAEGGTFHSWNHNGVNIGDVSLGSGDSNLHIWEIARIDSSHISVRKDRGSWTANNNYVPSGDLTVRFRPYMKSGSTNTITVNWVFVRKYAATEPTVSAWGPEDTGSFGGAGMGSANCMGIGM